VFLFATEQGHSLAVPRRTYRDGEIYVSSPVDPLRLESAFISSVAIETTYYQISRQILPCSEIIGTFDRNLAARETVSRYVEGMSLLASNIAARGITHLILAGPLSTSISQMLKASTGKGLSEHLRQEIPESARKDLIEPIVIVEYSAFDNTRGAVLLMEATEPVPGKSRWLLLSRQTLQVGQCQCRLSEQSPAVY